MSTNSMIGVQNSDGTVEAVYCHNDGYLEHNGRMLVEHYNNEEAARNIVALGALSFLAERLHPTPGVQHSFTNREEGVSVFYGRDRGETGGDAELYSGLYGILNCGPLRPAGAFVYVYVPGTGWTVSVDKAPFRPLVYAKLAAD